MGHRGMYYTSQSSDTGDERDWNHTHPDPRLHLGYSSFANPGVAGVNTMGYFNVPRSLNDVPFGNFDSEIPNYRATNSRLPLGPYLHHSLAGNSTRVPSTYVQRVPPWHDHFATGTTSNTFIPQTEYGRASYKRKTPTYSANPDSSSSSSIYCVGSSSGVQSNAGSAHQFWPPTSMVPDYRCNDLLARERSQRNVRRQYSGDLRLEPNSSGLPPMSNHPRYILPTNVSEPTILAPASFDPHRTFSDVGHFSHETIRTPLGGGLSSSGTRMYGGYHSNPISRSSPNPPLPAFHLPSARGTELGRAIHHAQRTPYEAIPSYRPIEFTVVGRPGVEPAAPLRYSRPLSFIGNSNETTGRGRNFYSRLQPFSDEGNSPDRWIPQGVAVTDWSAIFGPRDFSDHHRDMRLDIDDMSYELFWAQELLALEEMIGDVNTGLSEGTVGKCLTETTYSADRNQDDEEEMCIICLEEYKDCEDLARLDCGHDYHFSCIKKWLLIKNACPICKASVVTEEA